MENSKVKPNLRFESIKNETLLSSSSAKISLMTSPGSNDYTGDNKAENYKVN